MIGAAHKTILYDYVSAAKPPAYFFRSLLEKISVLDRLYMGVTKALDNLADQVGLRVAA